MGDLESAVAFLAGRGATVTVGGVPVAVAVSGPLDLGTEGPLPPMCIVQAAGPVGDEPMHTPERDVSYLLRFYGPDDLAALAAHTALRATLYSTIAVGIPLMHHTVSGRTLKWFTISAPTGPQPEPGTDRPVVLALGRARWAN